MCKPSTPYLTILDVGHGNAAVLHDRNGVVAIDAGRGQHLRRFLSRNGTKEVAALLLSHADTDHCSGAISLLLDECFRVHQVFLNPDPTKKDRASNRQLRLAIAEAGRKRGTITETQLTTALTGRIDQGTVRIEVLFPPPELAVSGVAGVDLDGKSISSNALSGAIRLAHEGEPIVLLAGDIQSLCLRHWEENGTDATAQVLVFPHHGGLPGDCRPEDVGAYATAVGQQVRPEVVVFSVHRTRYSLPREEVLTALTNTVKNVQFLCTQLPERISEMVVSASPGPWVLHRKTDSSGISCLEGNILISFSSGQYRIQFSTDAE